VLASILQSGLTPFTRIHTFTRTPRFGRALSLWAVAHRCHAELVSGNPYRGHRFPKEIISYVVWLYFRFGVSFRDVEELMAARGVLVSYETVRRWCDKIGHQFAAGLITRRARTGEKWHLDEVFLNINGVRQYLWRAVDQNGTVIDILVQPKRDRFAAMRFFRKLLRATGHRPRVIITDKLRSYGAAKHIVMRGVAHRQHRYLNNRAENSHQPTRERERRMRRFKSARHAQRFVEVHGIIGSHFRPRRHLLSAAAYRRLRGKRFRIWNEVTGAVALA
jgi:putative transposase